jgi:hypothetical protein
LLGHGRPSAACRSRGVECGAPSEERICSAPLRYEEEQRSEPKGTDPVPTKTQLLPPYKFQEGRGGPCQNRKTGPIDGRTRRRRRRERGHWTGCAVSTAGPAKGPAWQCAAPSCSCGGPFSVFSTDLESPGQGAPARLGPPPAVVRLRRHLAH